MADLQEYKCPNCGGALEFNSSIQKMKCPYCDSELDMSSLKKLDEQLKTQTDENMTWSTQAGGEWDTGEIDQLSVYVCKSCGGEIVADESTAATSCPFCDNPVVMMGRFAGDLKPDYVIPFKLDKKAAKANLNKHLMGKRLLPKVFKDQNHIDEVKGFMFRSGFLTQKQMRMFIIKQAGLEHGVIVSMTIPKQAIFQLFVPVS